MDDSKLRWIVFIAVLVIGTAYLVWLCLTYIKVKDYLAQNPVTVPGTVEKRADDG